MERFQNKQSDEPITIPVVVHIIYNNELENISDDQVQSQIDVLNEDFGKTNPYLTDKWPQAADTGIRFQLASVDPNGNSTKGITRKSSSKTSWSYQDLMKNSESGGVDPWNTVEYLNIWVCNISNGILGYAQYPGGKASTDGVVISPKYFGSSDKGDGFYLNPPFDKGRTATHEIGHFFNLRHVWGNSKSCGSDDLVDDTPESNGPNYGCQVGTASCGSEDMVENFMDYSDDTCMSIFTSGQRARMHAVLMEGGFRHGLATSNKFDTITTDLFTPKNVIVSELKSTEVLVSWDEVKRASYIVRYRLIGSEKWNETFALQTSILLRDLKDNSEYEVQVKSTCATNESSFSESVKFVTDTKDKYCVSKAETTNELYLAKVVIGNINNSSEGGTGYSDFTSNYAKVLKTHEVYIELTPEWLTEVNYECGYAVFVDYNQDGDFNDQGEKVFTVGKTSKPLINGSFVVPESASMGETRMRVVMKYNGTPENCEVFDYGEVEDYTLNIHGAHHDTNAPSTPENIIALEVKPKEVTLSWDKASDDVEVKGYEVYLNNEYLKMVEHPLILVDGLEPATDYKFSIKTRDCSGNTSESSEILVSTLKEEISYCDSRGKKSTYEWIDKVEIGSISNYSNSNNGYADYTSLETDLIRGEVTPIVVSAGFLNFSYTEFWSIWIDFNQDGSFDDDEKVVCGSSSSGENLFDMVYIPSSALLGKTRMRVSMKYKTMQSACEFFTEGEVEDYTINIIDSNEANIEEADITGASEIGEVEELKITTYPNPTVNHVNVIVDEKQEQEIVSYNIINATGQVIRKEKMNSLKIDVSDLSLGVYILEFYDGQKKFQTRIVKR
ncbi:GEVED domain-containing protein [uncultured Tenacibaculum sp.]|uniref:GEVED domain-containing protein n=1 Tax=uncultured Tenacibaculum sp. TaxID=174713 RepID=UPI00261B95E2|nr:GEVED domain-containing protein [uncultured Tenacibaculum sp.]